MKIIEVAFLCCMFFCCSKETEVIVEEVEEMVDFESIPGRYIGIWDWEFGRGTISMELTQMSESENYTVKFYETSNFKPMFNSDGITPEAQGQLIVEGTIASIDLNLNTDQPPCQGNYIGEGERTTDGKLTLIMNIEHDCAQDAEATWELMKISN